MSDAGNKVMRIFTKLKQRAKETTKPVASESGFGQVTPLREIQPNIAELQQSAMNSYRIGPEVVKTDGGVNIGGYLFR